jgi:hypothetical protein
MHGFVRRFAPHLTQRLIELAVRAPTPEAIERLFADVELPTR